MRKSIFDKGFYALLVAALITLPLPAEHVSAADSKESASQLDESEGGSEGNTNNPETDSEAVSKAGADDDSGNNVWLYGGLGVAALAAGVGMAAGGGGGSDGGGVDPGLVNTRWQSGSSNSFNNSRCSGTWSDGVLSLNSNGQAICSGSSSSGGRWAASGSSMSYGCTPSDSVDEYKCTAISANKYKCWVEWDIWWTGVPRFTCRNDYILVKI